jgi:Fe-S-cluster containining protein
MWNSPVYACQECGACCLSGVAFSSVDYVFLRQDEAKRMKRLGLTVVQVEGRPFLGARPHAGAGGLSACVAFAGQLGGQCGCSIYLDRPANCRAFEMGGAGCQQARAEAGLPV